MPKNLNNNGNYVDEMVNYVDEAVKYVDVQTNQTIGYDQGSRLKHRIPDIH
jgi:hypothetical protein